MRVSLAALFSLLLAACAGAETRPGGPPTVNVDPEGRWTSLPSVDEAIIGIMDRDSIAGLSACLVVDGEVVWCGAYGERNTDTGELVYPSTPFLVASVSKTVTAVAILQAVEDGALTLDAEINDLLPFEVRHPADPDTEITLRHLMAHTSGIADNWDLLDPFYVDGDSPVALGDLMERYLVEGGDAYSADDNFMAEGVAGISEYSNIGISLAAYVAEVATGTPFSDFCEARIFEPLGMNASWFLADFDEELVALPTLVEDGEFVTVPHYGVPDYPDGQLRVDAPSLAVFAAMLATGGVHDGAQVVQSASIEAALVPAWPELDPEQGLILYRWELDDDSVWGHSGGETGAAAELLIRESDGAAVVVMMNSEDSEDTLTDVERAILAGIDEL